MNVFTNVDNCEFLTKILKPTAVKTHNYPFHKDLAPDPAPKNYLNDLNDLLVAVVTGSRYNMYQCYMRGRKRLFVGN